MAIGSIFLLTSVQAEDLSCRTGGPAAQSDYVSTIRLLQEGKQLTPAQERQIISSLEAAVVHRCKMAAIALADIRANQIGWGNSGMSSAEVEKIEDQIHALVQEAEAMGDGSFLLGVQYFTSGSKYYAPKKGIAILERAAAAAEPNAVEFLVRVYENGADGVPKNQSRADYWRSRMAKP